MRMAHSVFNLPRELQFEIVDWLDVDDLKEFSICSKACRGLVAPFLYRSIRFDPDILAASAIECVDGIAKYSKRLIFNADVYDDEYHRKHPFSFIQLSQALESRLHLFSNVTSLEIRYNTADDVEPNFHAAFFPKLWASSVWNNLKKIDLDLGGTSGHSYTRNGDPVAYAYSDLSDTQKDYLGEKKVLGDDWRGLELKLPPKVEEAVIQVAEFSFQMPWAGYAIDEYCELYYISLARASEKLRKLDIRAGLYAPLRSSGKHGESIPSKWDIETCLGITHLMFQTYAFTPWDLDNITDRFSGLEELEVSETEPSGVGGPWPVDEVVYVGIQKLKQLRRASLPWPVYDNVQPEISGDEPRSFAAVERLKSSVDMWTSNGMEKLQKVVFGVYGAQLHPPPSPDLDFQRVYRSRWSPEPPDRIVVILVKRKNSWVEAGPA